MRKAGPHKVHVLVIQHRHGDDLYVCRTTAGAGRQLAGYVREWWDHEMSGPMPRRRSERIDEYFREMGESRQKEFYSISEEDLLD